MSGVPVVSENPVLCEKCGRESEAFIKREVGGVLSLVDRDGSVVYDLVRVCVSCGEVMHWHSKEKTMLENARMYKLLLEELYKPSGRAYGNSND